MNELSTLADSSATGSHKLTYPNYYRQILLRLNNMKHLILSLFTLLAVSHAAADYSRDYLDTAAVRTADSEGTSITYRVFNESDTNPKLLLVMGLGGAGSAWGDAFIQNIESQGFEIIVIDNRDTGGSDLFTDWGTPTVWWQILKYELGFSVDAPYTLDDMASDSIAVLDAEGH